MKKVLHVLGNVFVTLIVVLAVVMTVAVITSVRSEKVHMPNLFGYAMLSVQTDSMESENGFSAGDIIIVRMLDTEEANNLSVGDVISFIRSLNSQDYLETHRIVSCEGDSFIPPQEIEDGIWVRGGTRYYTTKGDNTPGIDKVYGSDVVEYTSCTKIYGIWTGTRVPHLGTVMDFLQSSMGFMLCVVLPVALFFIYQLYIFIMTLTRTQKEKALKEVSSKEEELKQKAIAEFLAKQQAEGGAPATDAQPASPPDPAPDPAAEPAKSAETAESAAPAAPAEPEKSGKKNKKDKKNKSDSSKPAKGDEGKGEALKDDAAPSDPPASKPAKDEPAKEETEEKKEAKTESASADAAPAADISEEEKNRIIQEYLAKQAQEKKD